MPCKENERDQGLTHHLDSAGMLVKIFFNDLDLLFVGAMLEQHGVYI